MKEKMFNLQKTHIRIIVVIIIFTLLFMSLFNFTSNATINNNDTEDSTVIKIGYVLNYGTIKSPIINGEEGYGYEYLTKIFEYAPGSYELEFIYCDWEESKSMLENGELDIIGPTTYFSANEDCYLYPDKSFGDNAIFLSTLNSENTFDDIDGSKIAVQENNPNEYMLIDFLEENNFNAEIVYFTNNDYEAAIKRYDCDFCLTSSLQTVSELIPVTTLGILDFYYVTSSNNTELIEIINIGMESLAENEFFYQEQLYLKYYDYTIKSSYYITDEDYALLQSQNLYTIGVEITNSPICYLDNNGDFAGIAIDVLEMVTSSAGINYEIVEVNNSTTDEELSNLDFSFLALDQEDSLNFHNSNSYYEIPLFLVDRLVDSDEVIKTIGTLSYYGITDVTLDDSIYNRTVYEYDDIVDLKNAYNSGEIDSFIIPSTTLNSIRNDIDDLDFISTPLDSNLNLFISFPLGYSNDKIDIFNRILAQLDESEISVLATNHSSKFTSTYLSVFDLLKLYPILIIGLFCIVLLIFGISEWKRRKELSKLVNIDELTGLFTERKFTEDARHIISTNPNNTFSIIALDIDNFKYINEFYGYDNGNKVIQTLAKNIKDNSSYAKLISRSDADNFLLLVKNKNLLTEINSAKVNDGNGLYKELNTFIDSSYNIIFSIGVYAVTDKTLSLNFMIDCANIAKNLGKNKASITVNQYTPEMNNTRLKNNDIVSNMYPAIKNNEFILYYQPKYDLCTKEIIGAEALVRWFKNGSLVPPNDFIPLFERNGFIEQLDYYVLSNACKFISENPTVPKISVNLSGVTVLREDLVDKILGIFNKYNAPHEKIDLEITESAFVEKIEQSQFKILALQSLGFTISMDDFGAGLSSLNRLKHLPINTLKIDREFIIDSIENIRGTLIIKNIMSMAKDLDLETVAEGIETKEQEDFLQEIGCDIGQGYYFSKPITEEEFLKLLEETKK